MSSQHREPRLEEMLVDSIFRAVMEADGVDPRELEAELRQCLRGCLRRCAGRVPQMTCAESMGRRNIINVFQICSGTAFGLASPLVSPRSTRLDHCRQRNDPS